MLNDSCDLPPTTAVLDSLAIKMHSQSHTQMSTLRENPSRPKRKNILTAKSAHLIDSFRFLRRSLLLTSLLINEKKSNSSLIKTQFS